MSCICQYIINSQLSENNTDQIVSFALPNSNQNDESTDADHTQSAPTAFQEAVTDDIKISGCVSELASCRAENWLLKKKLREYKMTIGGLEQLMSTIVNKQQQILTDMLEVRKRNMSLEYECHLQREYHSIERDALIKELHDAKSLVKEHIHPLMSEEEDDLKEDKQSTDSQEFGVNWNTDSDEDDNDDNDNDNNNDNDDDDDDDDDDNDDDAEDDDDDGEHNCHVAGQLVNSSCGSMCSSSTDSTSASNSEYSEYEGHGPQHEEEITGTGSESD